MPAPYKTRPNVNGSTDVREPAIVGEEEKELEPIDGDQAAVEQAASGEDINPSAENNERSDPHAENNERAGRPKRNCGPPKFYGKVVSHEP